MVFKAKKGFLSSISTAKCLFDQHTAYYVRMERRRDSSTSSRQIQIQIQIHIISIQPTTFEWREDERVQHLRGKPVVVVVVGGGGGVVVVVVVVVVVDYVRMERRRDSSTSSRQALMNSCSVIVPSPSLSIMLNMSSALP